VGVYLVSRPKPSISGKSIDVKWFFWYPPWIVDKNYYICTPHFGGITNY
jgi:hypothetical protein